MKRKTFFLWAVLACMGTFAQSHPSARLVSPILSNKLTSLAGSLETTTTTLQRISTEVGFGMDGNMDIAQLHRDSTLCYNNGIPYAKTVFTYEGNLITEEQLFLNTVYNEKGDSIGMDWVTMCKGEYLFNDRKLLTDYTFFTHYYFGYDEATQKDLVWLVPHEKMHIDYNANDETCGVTLYLNAVDIWAISPDLVKQLPPYWFLNQQEEMKYNEQGLMIEHNYANYEYGDPLEGSFYVNNGEVTHINISKEKASYDGEGRLLTDEVFGEADSLEWGVYYRYALTDKQELECITEEWNTESQAKMLLARSLVTANYEEIYAWNDVTNSWEEQLKTVNFRQEKTGWVDSTYQYKYDDYSPHWRLYKRNIYQYDAAGNTIADDMYYASLYSTTGELYDWWFSQGERFAYDANQVRIYYQYLFSNNSQESYYYYSGWPDRITQEWAEESSIKLTGNLLSSGEPVNIYDFKGTLLFNKTTHATLSPGLYIIQTPSHQLKLWVR